MYTGHAEVLVFGRKQQAVDAFDELGEQLYVSSFRAQFISGFIQPAMTFVGNLNYVLIAVVGGLRVASGTLSVGDVQAFVQYSYEFNGPITQVAAMANLLQSGVASAERVFDLLDAEEEEQGPALRHVHGSGRAGSPSRTSPSATSRERPSSRTCRSRSNPAGPSRSSARPAPGRPRSSTC